MEILANRIQTEAVKWSGETVDSQVPTRLLQTYSAKFGMLPSLP